ncbi:MAG: hypothetical protein ACT4NJ_06150 [Nitrosopumilaceae archaeon]
MIISILLIVVSIEPHEAFAKKDGDGGKHDGKDNGKHDDKKKKEKHDKKDKKKHDEEVTSDDDDDDDEEVTSNDDDDEEVTSNDDDDDEVTSNDDDEEGNTNEEEPKFEPLQFKGSGDDYAPTLGSDRYGNNYVDNGFTFNDFTADVKSLKTHMPLQTLNVGELNTAVLKIYDNRGAGKIEHVELAFGLNKKQHVSESRNKITWEQDFKGTQSIIMKDPDNMLMDVNALGEADGKIMKITFNFAFREPMEQSRIGVTVWDQDKHSKTFYFNEGIEVVGKSLNPPKIVTVLDSKGYPVQITMTGKNTGIDEEGNTWTHNSPWMKLSQPAEDQLPHESLDPVSAHGFDRMNSMFDSYKNDQALEAQKKLMEILGGRNISNFSD